MIVAIIILYNSKTVFPQSLPKHLHRAKMVTLSFPVTTSHPLPVPADLVHPPEWLRIPCAAFRKHHILCTQFLSWLHWNTGHGHGAGGHHDPAGFYRQYCASNPVLASCGASRGVLRFQEKWIPGDSGNQSHHSSNNSWQ